MREYPKINTVFKRDPATKHKTLIEGDYSEDTFRYLADNEWVFTEKVNGTNVRVMVLDGTITFGGKSDNAQMPAALMKRLAERFLPIQHHLYSLFPNGACLYGEGYGAKIQNGGDNYRPDQDFVLFDVKIGEWWLQRDAVEDIADNILLDIVPIIGRGTLHDMVQMARSGFSSRWGDFEAEGIVARPLVELRTRYGERIITKIKCRDFPVVT